MYNPCCNDSILLLEYESSHAIDDTKQMDVVVLKKINLKKKKQMTLNNWSSLQ